MGLSNEERFSKFFWGVEGWRRELMKLSAEVLDSQAVYKGSETCKEVVADWIRRIDLMTGLVHRANGNGGIYWLAGEGDSCLRALLSDPYLLKADAHPEGYALPTPHKDESAAGWGDADFSMTASRLEFPPFKSREGVKALAQWWDAYGYLSHIAYPIYRYDDDLFTPEVKRVFTELSGEIINRRFDVCFSYWVDKSDHERVERYLLLKHRAFHLLLEEDVERLGLHGEGYFEKEYDGRALYEIVGKMSAKDLIELFKKHAKAQDERQREHNLKHSDQEKPDGVLGPPVPKKKEAEAEPEEAKPEAEMAPAEAKVE